MAAVTKVSPFSDNVQPTAYGDCAGDVIVNQFYVDITAVQIATSAMFDIGILPAYHTVVDMVLIPGDLDSVASITLDVGMLTGTPGDATSDRTMGAEFFSGSTSAQTGVAERMSLATGFKVIATEADRSIGVKIAVDAATAVAGRIRVLCFTAPSDHKTQF